MFNQILRPLARRAIQQAAPKRLGHDGGHGHSNFKYVTLDEACHPEGSWKENFDKKQAKYNIQLVAGVSCLVLTILAVKQFELIFFNFGPPKPKENLA